MRKIAEEKGFLFDESDYPLKNWNINANFPAYVHLWVVSQNVKILITYEVIC